MPMLPRSVTSTKKLNFQMFIFSEVSGSHNGEDEDDMLIRNVGSLTFHSSPLTSIMSRLYKQ
jgi:hypothetical protein